MEWDFRYSGSTEFMDGLVADGIAKRAALPPKPQLYADLQDVYYAFYWIGAGRGYNEGGPQPLLWTEIFAYLSETGVVDPEERRAFQHFIRVMDSKYLDLVHEKIKKDRERLLAESKKGRNK